MKKIVYTMLTILLILTGCNQQPVETASSAASSNVQFVTIPEGYTLPRIAMLLESKGICTGEAFIAAAKTEDFSGYPLMNGLYPESDCFFKMEGYLYPDTYAFNTDESPKEVIGKMLANTETKLDDSLRSEIEQSGYTLHEIMTLASIIQKEAENEEEMPSISAMLRNRLAEGMNLVSISALDYVEKVINVYDTEQTNDYGNRYNTAIFAGLPAGPICNPGSNAIAAALHPAQAQEINTVSQANQKDTNTSTPEQKTPAQQTSEPANATLSITIPEGYTLPRIGMLLEEKGVCTAEEFIQAAQTGNFSEYPLVAQQDTTANRCFKLEGYLFPDTYEIYTTDTPDKIIRRMLANTESRIDSTLRAQIGQSGYTTDEILTMASIIEKESFGRVQMPKISSVLHNRLEIGMRLQCDVTIIYVEGAIKNFITGDVNRYNSDYNTYKCNGLPAGAICNPGIEAIKAALQPEQSDYLYFITDQDKNYYYAVTWDEHKQNVTMVSEKNKAQ